MNTREHLTKGVKCCVNAAHCIMLHEKHVLHVLSEIRRPGFDKRRAPDTLGNFDGRTSWKEVVKVRKKEKKSDFSQAPVGSSFCELSLSLSLNSLVRFDRKKKKVTQLESQATRAQ